jgi:sRNA-binding protein
MPYSHIGEALPLSFFVMDGSLTGGDASRFCAVARHPGCQGETPQNRNSPAACWPLRLCVMNRGMTSKVHKNDLTRGLKEYSVQIEALRAKWPKAFPQQFGDVRPLASGTVRTIVETFGWSQRYTRGILHRWKARDAYCHAVLVHSKRITLDGLESSEEVDDNARAGARGTIERRKAKRLQEAARKAAKPALAPAVTSAPDATIPVAVVPATPAPTEIVIPVDELRARVRASLSRRSA